MSTSVNDYHRTKNVETTRRSLNPADQKILQNNEECLHDEIINAAQRLLKDKYCSINGLQDTLLVAGGHVSLSGNTEHQFVQIVHDDTHQHWLVVTNLNCSSGELRVYCSMQQVPSSRCLYDITRFVNMKKSKIKINVMNVARQKGTKDCGVYAVAYTETLLSGLDPVNVIYEQSVMRGHLLKCLLDNNLTPFPTTSYRTTRKQCIRSVDVNLFCVCRASNVREKPMIQCHVCKNWFHPNCVGLSNSDFDLLCEAKTPYECELCQKLP
jgi:hypothetical protein